MAGRKAQHFETLHLLKDGYDIYGGWTEMGTSHSHCLKVKLEHEMAHVLHAGLPECVHITSCYDVHPCIKANFVVQAMHANGVKEVLARSREP